jgi:hypothetical protein
MRWWFVALLVACGPDDADSKPVEYGLRNQDWDGDGFDRPDDCNDSDPEAFPGAVERCNGIDDDCDDAIDDDIAVTYYRDRDGDGWGAPEKPFDICWHPDGYVEQSGDCDDMNAAISPDADEICDIDGTDEDCNGLANEADPGLSDALPAYVDADHDGFGVGAPDYVLCFATPGLALVDGDCDDTSAGSSPERVEVCDPADVDEDCDGLADDSDPEGPWEAIAWFVDADGDGFGDPATGPRWFCDGASSGWVADASDCDDGDAIVYPNRYEDCDDGLDNDCDGMPDDCGAIPAIDLGTADLIVIGDVDGYELGYSVSWADLDGDGVPELLLGTPRGSVSSPSTGVVHVVPGESRGEHNAGDLATAILEGGETYQRFGGALRGLRDDDGDGYDGVAVGAHGNWEIDGVWIFEGPLSGTVGQGSADAHLELGGEYGQCSVALTYGDVNDDGARDYVVGCAADYVVGQARLALGPLSGTVGDSDGSLMGISESDLFGLSVTVVGDTDGDGTDDVAVGAPGYGDYDGVAFLVLAPDFVSADADVLDVASGSLYGLADEWLGYAMAAGDVNGDGYADLFVAATGARIGGDSDVGRVYGILGPVDEAMSSADVQFDGVDRGDTFGASIAADGDVNGDGWADVIIGATTADHAAGFGQTGGAYLFYGPMSSGTRVGTDARARLDGRQPGDFCGSSVTLVPDVSGDGRADVLVGSLNMHDGPDQPGGAYLVTSDRL